MKNINERCPLSEECEKKKCKYVRQELECSYYLANSRPGYEIADQEVQRLQVSDAAFIGEGTGDGNRLVYIPVERLVPHPDNPRKELGDLTELAASIKENGIFQNLTVVPEVEDRFTVIIGHRRLAAAKLAGLTELPCVIVEMTPKEQVQTMLLENMQRTDLTVYEQAQGFQLILDMGETMESLAKDSGFSVSTIRRRVKLLELDQDKFRKAEARGATLMDYMELDKIEDPARKNAVLDTIGTPNFRNKLQSAIDEEKCIKRLDAWEAEISKFAVNIKKKGEVDGERVPMEWGASFNRWSGVKKVERPEDVNSRKYWYVRTGTEIIIYKEVLQRKSTPEDQEREERRAASERVEAELQEITKRHFTLRSNFVTSLSQSAVKKHFAEVAEFAMHWIIGDGAYRRDEPEEEVMRLAFDVDLDDDNMDYEQLRKTLSPMMLDAPERSLLCLIYSMVDDDSTGYWNSQWNRDTQVQECIYKPNDDLDRLYTLLAKLGYEVSDEEAEMMNGTHCLFQ